MLGTLGVLAQECPKHLPKTGVRKVVFWKGDAVLSKKLYSLGTSVSRDSRQSLEAARVA